METNLLTLGDMLAFIGLIIAAIQLSKPRLLLMWKLTSASLRYFAIVLLILGYLSPLIATFMSKDVNKLELFGKGLSVAEFTQIMGFLLISFGVIVVGYIFSSYNRRHLPTLTTKYKIHRHKYPKKKWSTFQITVERKRVVTTRSARKFYFITSKYFVRGHIEAVVEAIGANLEPLVFSAKQYDPHIYRMIDDENKEKLKPVGANYCFETLLQLLSDDSAMQHICTSNRPFLHALINHEVNVGSNNNRNELSIILYENVLEKLLLNPKSFIYSQMNTHEGSARFVNIYSLLTQDKIIRRHNIIPSMITWNANNAKVPLDSYTKALTKLLERIVKSYKADPDNDMRITQDKHDKFAKDIEREQQDLNDKLKMLTNGNTQFQVTTSYLLGLAQRAEQLFKESDPALQNKLLESLLSNIKLKDKKLSYVLNDPFKSIVEAKKKSLSAHNSNIWWSFTTKFELNLSVRAEA